MGLLSDEEALSLPLPEKEKYLKKIGPMYSDRFNLDHIKYTMITFHYVSVYKSMEDERRGS